MLFWKALSKGHHLTSLKPPGSHCFPLEEEAFFPPSPKQMNNLSQTCSWVQETQTTLSTEHKQLREQPENFPTLRLSPSPLPLGGSLWNQDSNPTFWLSPFSLLHSVLTKHDCVPNTVQRLWRGDDASGRDESRSCSSFPTGHLRGQRSSWATEPGQTTAAGTGQSIPAVGLCRQCPENFRWPTNTDTNHQQANKGEKRLYRARSTHKMKACCGSTATDWWRSRPAASPSPKSGTCPSWPPSLLFSLSSKKLSSRSVLRVTEITFSQELKCQEERHKKAWAGAFRNRKEVVTAVIYCGRFCSVIATYHYTSFILFHLAGSDSFPISYRAQANVAAFQTVSNSANGNKKK